MSPGGKRISAPRLAGFTLRSVEWLARSSLGGPLRRRMVRDAGVLLLDELAIDEAPAFWPPLGPPPPMSTAADTGSAPTANAVALGSELETIAHFGEAYRRSELTPLEVAERVIAAIRDSEAQTPPMRTFIAHDVDDVMHSARESTRRFQRGESRGPLEGVPIAVKDELDQRPYASTVGRGFGVPAVTDATVVERLRNAGALLLGKTNMHEIGIGVTGLNPHHGTARNPHDPLRHTGGSSSGSAAAVAMGLCPVAIGADGGGSIRIPAAFCGVVGLKPTFGRVSEHGAAPLCWSLAHVGPLAATVADAALVYRTIAGPDPRDSRTLGQPPPTTRPAFEDLRGVKVGVFRAWFEDADAGVVSACQTGLDALVSSGATLVEVKLDHIELARIAHLVTIGCEMVSSQKPHFREHFGDYGVDTRLLFTLVSSFPSTLYVSAQRARARVAAELREVLSQVDVLATPATGCVAPPVPNDALESGESNLELFDAIMRYAPIANLVGLPAISVPVGSAEGLPVGLQLMAAPWREHVLLQLGAVVEAQTARRLPRLHYRMLK